MYSAARRIGAGIGDPNAASWGAPVIRLISSEKDTGGREGGAGPAAAGAAEAPDFFFCFGAAAAGAGGGRSGTIAWIIGFCFAKYSAS